MVCGVLCVVCGVWCRVSCAVCGVLRCVYGALLCDICMAGVNGWPLVLLFHVSHRDKANCGSC